MGGAVKMKEEETIKTSLDLDFAGDDFVIDSSLPKTPDQMPDALDFSALPESALRSNALESVLQQNEDLMSRLSVSLRRISFLEGKVKDVATEAEKHRERHDNLKDQILVLKEQAKRLAAKNEAFTAERARHGQIVDELKEQVRILEVRYAELFQSHRSSRLKVDEELGLAERETNRYRKYRQKIKLAVPNLRRELESLKVHLGQRDATLADLRKNLNETTQYITEQGQIHKRELRELTEAYEAKLKAATFGNQTLAEQNKLLEERVKQFDRVQSERYQLENELVVAKRRESDARENFEIELREMQTQLAKYRNESKQLAVELQSTSTARDEAKSAYENERRLNQKLNEQVESLQALWQEQQTKIESLTEQKASLQRLNQELSVASNKQRLEIRELREKLESTRA